MLQVIQDLRSGAIEVAEIPDPSARPGAVLVRTTWSLISPGTEQAVAATRRALGEEAFASAWEEGRARPLEEVIGALLQSGEEAGKP